MKKRGSKCDKKWNKKTAVVAAALAMAAWLPLSSASMLVNAEEVSPEGAGQEEVNPGGILLDGTELGGVNLNEWATADTELEEIRLWGQNLVRMNPEEGASEEGISEDGVASQAEEGSNITATGTSGDNVTWVLTDDGTLTISGTGTIVTIPAVNWHYLYYSSYIKNIVINEGISGIGETVFNDCKNLTEIKIPNSVTSIGQSAFSGCSSITEIDLPDSITSIEANAFSGCSSLTKINLPDGISSIRSNMFRDCSSLAEVKLSDNITRIDECAFLGCISLAMLKIPNNVIDIGQSAFWGCKGLKEIKLPDSLTSIGKYAFKDCSSIKEIYLPNGVTSIGDFAFEGCQQLTSIELPDSLTAIGQTAFMNCISLEKITLSNNLTEIPDFLCGECWNLVEIVIPEGVTKIGRSAFADCKSLTEIVIPASIMIIKGSAFGGCTSLKEIYFEGNAPEFSNKEPLEPFYNVTANVYYPTNNTTWTSANMLNYGGNLTWIAEGQRQPDSQQPDRQPTELQIVPEVTDEVYVIGSATGAVIKCTGELKDFVSIAVDDVVLAPSDYTAVSGSTVITIMSSYLDKLSVGKHKVTLNYTYGSVDTTLIVLNRKTGSGTASDILNVNGANPSGSGSQSTGTAAGNQDNSQKAPKTGEESKLPWIMTAMAFGIVGLTLLGRDGGRYDKTGQG